MSKFGCIDFYNDNIILSKDGLEKTRIKGVFLEPICYLGVEGYNVYILKAPNSLSQKVWHKIEDELLRRNIYYVAMREKGIVYPFEQIQETSGDIIKNLLASCILDYIFKYNLIERDNKYAKVAIIGGRINDTLDILLPIVDNVTDLTLFTEDPQVYREMTREIYEKTKVRMKLMYPNRRIMNEMDIIYDVNEEKTYVNWCKTKAIYVDFFRKIQKGKVKLEELTPSIWQDFEIVCEKYSLDKSLLEAVLYTDGLTRHILRKKIKNFDIRISRVYTVSKS